MADIELVIKIPEVFYEALRKTDMMVSGQRSGKTLMSVIYNAVANGTPLPKGHGRLIDADELKKEYPHDTDWDYPVNTNSYVVESIDNSHTIIEADKESEDA